ncbi:DUF2188 domain-containing protein [Caulobacter sp. NIBR2454]|uniref:DUF2188 domain-containing protein n=1 Tax=Caulobacter sp. NIBR2454 TaxID=3015996 RepID=UPI0022B6CBDF|nr:DUF2188 domain-containing protein [Caulobacter sp. NIBR2454]
MAAKPGFERIIFTVLPHDGQWAVESDGAFTNHSSSKEEVKAAANKMARAAQDAGTPCQVRVSGEHGFAAAAV